MRKIVWALFISLFLVLSCNKNSSQLRKDSKAPGITLFANTVESDVTTTEYLTHSGKHLTLNEVKSGGASIRKLEVIAKGYTERDDTIGFGDTDPVFKVLQTDLDSDGFEELFIITQSTGSGSYGTIFGIGSYLDKHISAIYIPEVTENDTRSGGLFEGYMGHEKYEVEDEFIVCKFPFYNETDQNSNPTGGQMSVYYSLSNEDKSIFLIPKYKKYANAHEH